jgi:hypothetical protein
MPRLAVFCRVVFSGVAFSLAVCGLGAGGSTAFAQVSQGDMSPAMQDAVEQSRQAINDCRDKRQRGELPSYKASAQCSNPRIFAAWQAAQYPHMDLITQWLNAREAASDRVDQHQLSPDQFEQQMDDVTVRLTAEEQRRRNGVVGGNDADMQLQLPPAGQVVGVATPPGQEKLTEKKSAAARQRAAASWQSAAAPSGIGHLAALASLDGQSAHGIGGPFVPVNPNSPAARAALAAAAPGEGSDGLYAHLASQRSESDARLAYRSLEGHYGSTLANRDAVIRRVDDPGQGTFYRVEVGPMSSAEADALCNDIKSNGGQCVPRFE